MKKHKFSRTAFYAQLLCEVEETLTDLHPELDQDGLGFLCSTCGETITLTELVEAANAFKLTT